MKRVLVIDGHAYVRDTLVELLGSEVDLTVVGSGANAAAAVELVDLLTPDVVVIDVQMLRVDGVNATQEICQRQPRTRIVILTAAPHGQLASRALAAGACACLAKSGHYRDLVEVIHAGRGRALRSQEVPALRVG